MPTVRGGRRWRGRWLSRPRLDGGGLLFRGFLGGTLLLMSTFGSLLPGGVLRRPLLLDLHLLALLGRLVLRVFLRRALLFGLQRMRTVSYWLVLVEAPEVRPSFLMRCYNLSKPTPLTKI